MAKGNGKSEEVLVGKTEGRRNGNQRPDTPGITDINHWSEAYESLPFYTIIEKILDTPSDMLGLVIRSVIKDDNQANAYIQLNAWCTRFHCEPIRDMLKLKLATSAAMGGRARMESLFGATRLIAPAMYRDILGLKKREQQENEQVSRGPSDYREKREGED